MTDSEIIDAILLREGGYVDHASDRGGVTNFGITLATLANYRGRPVIPSDVEHMTESEARTIYRERYIEAPGFSAIADADLRALLVDMGVNHGPANAIKMLQRAIKCEPDGALGPVTLAALNSLSARSVRARVTAQRAKFYGALISAHPEQAVFAAGWMARLSEFIEALA
jgi:lysozyme family protein